MPLSRRQRLWLAWSLFISWLLLSSIALYRFGNSHYGVFDPELQWAGQTVPLSLAALNITAASERQLVHVLDNQCGCSRLARQHLQALSAELEQNAVEQHFRSAAELAAAGFQLPAVPAVLVFQHGKLLYAGPYASGPLCSPGNSFLPALFSGQSRLPGTWLNGETKACRCLVSPGT